MPARTVFSPETLPASVSKIFDQAQTTTANHQKNLVALFKLHSEAATLTETVEHGLSEKLVGERLFEDAFMDMLVRVLPVKKGASVADRILKFIGNYIRFMNEKYMEQRQEKQNEDEGDEETTASRFVVRVLRFLLKGCSAKDKVVRFRVVQCIAEMISHLGELDEDWYALLRSALLERIRDREVPVRVQAAIALCKICGVDDPSEPPTITEVLMDSLCYDVAPDVRRAILINIPPGPTTIPSILTRTRDVDAVVRRSVYSVVFNPETPTGADAKTEHEIGATHPRALTITQREMIVKNGLGDREETVKAAAIKLLTSWIDLVMEGADKGEAEKDEADSNVIAFLRLFDLHECSVPEDALLRVFAARPDILDSIEFSDAFWDNLTPEKAFLVRVFTDHCVTSKDDARLESALPVVTALAFKIQSSYNGLLESIQFEDEESLLRGGTQDPEYEEQRVKREEERLDKEFVISEMLKLAVNLDYADEIGRRKMFQLVRDMISQDTLPEPLVARCLDVLRKLSPSERDLIRVVVEVVHELRDPSDEDEQLKDQSGVDDGITNYSETPATVKTVRALPKPVIEMTHDEKIRADAIDARCLSLCIGMLERVNGRFEDNSTLEGVLGELIIPSVKRKELLLREKGLVSLGLCCLIARRMALNSFQLFLGQIQSAPVVLKLRVLQIVFDILMVNEGDFLGPGSTNGERIIEFLLHVLDREESPDVQALICAGISKLMLSGMITDDRVLRSLVLVYLSPETVDNQELRQCLTYFFPVYCYSSPANQRRMQKIFVEVYTKLCQASKEWDGDEDAISLAQAGSMFVDWTDPQKSAAVSKAIPDLTPDYLIHIDLSNDIVKLLFSDELTRDEKKALSQLLGKLYIPDEVDDNKLRTLKLLIHNLRVRRPLRDTSSKNAFNKFDEALTKKFGQQLEAFSEEEYRQLGYLKEVFEFLDDIIPMDDDDGSDTPKKRPARKRRSESVITESDTHSVAGASEDEWASGGAKAKGKGKGKAKRRRLNQSDEESAEDDDATERGNSPPAAPTRVMPRRSAAEVAKKVVSSSIKSARRASSDGDDDDDDDDDDEETPPPPPPSRTATSSRRKSQIGRRRTQGDDNNDSIIDQSRDSIMDTSLEDEDEEDAEEVNDIL